MGKLPNLFQSTHHSIQSRSKSSDIKRIVITSSTVAVGLTPHKGPYTEKEWNDPAVKEVNEKGNEASGMAKYSVSKVRAEEGRSQHWGLVPCPDIMCPSCVGGL